MPHINPSLLKLIGDGFVSDDYAADGSHLRWMFDHRLGFPRFSFCLDRRPGMGIEHSLQGVELLFQNFTEPLGLVNQIIRSSISVQRPQGMLQVSGDGIALEERKLIIDFHGGSAPVADPYACWVQLQFKVKVPGSKLQADALYDNRSADEVVDRVTLAFVREFNKAGLRPPDRLLVSNLFREAGPVFELLENPQLGLSQPQLQNEEERRLFRRLRQIDQARYARVTPDFIRRLLAIILEQGLQVKDLGLDRTVSKFVTVQLRAERIDRVSIIGSGAFLQSVAWVHAEDLLKADLWEPVGCFPIATKEDDYFSRNKADYNGLNPDELAEQRLLAIMPNGAGPLDDRQVPPSRPPTPAERQARYLQPWLEQLEPWVSAILQESLSGVQHQSETVLHVNLTEAGQVSGAGVHPTVAAMSDHTMDTRPYSLLLAASTAFPVAQLLGMAAIDRPPDIDHIDIWDYRLRGRWRVQDIETWGLALERRLRQLIDNFLAATPAHRTAAAVEFMKAKQEADNALIVIQQLLAGAVNGIVELWALKMGVRATKHALFSEPSNLSATKDGLAMPGAGASIQAVARLAWPLRQRARVIFDEEIPIAAAIGRDPGGAAGAFPAVINPPDPRSGFPLAVIPVPDPDDVAASSTAVYFDRRVDEGITYRYGLSESDPFGRWSRFRETTFRWVYDILPAPPAQISAGLQQTGQPPRLILTVTFTWARDLFPPANYSFKVHLRRSAPPVASANDPGQWGHFSRQPGVLAAPFSFTGTQQTDAASHDSMPVTISFSDRSVADPAGNIHDYRDYVLTFDGLELLRDNIDRASVWIGISAHDDVHNLESAEVGGPAPAAHILNVPPPPPPLPPDPELASFADAEGLSSYTLSWPGAANVRYLVYRAGEQELVRLLQDRQINTAVYDPAAAPNFRAAALKQLAPQAQDAFQVRSELVPEPPRYPDNHPNPLLRGRFQESIDWPALSAAELAFTDQLGGDIRTLTVYTVLGKSRSGILSSWPAGMDSFVVVAVPRKPEPARPQVLRAAWQPPLDIPVAPPQAGAARAELLIVQPPPESAPVAAYEVYRTLDPAKSRDYRLMRPLHRLEMPAFDSALPGFEGTPLATYIDPTVSPWKTYFYRVVARAPGQNGGTIGMRSEASAVAQVVTLSGAPPELPADIVVTRAVGPDLVQVSFTAVAPTTSAGDFQFDLIHLQTGSRLIVARSTAANARQNVGPDSYLLTADGSRIDEDDTLIIRITDPLGRSSETAPFLQRQPPDLTQLRTRTIFGILTVEIRSAAPIAPPIAGAFMLEFFTLDAPSPIDPDPQPERRVSQALHEIPAFHFNGWQRTGPDGNGRFIYRTRFTISGTNVAAVIVTLTDPTGLESTLRANI